MREDSVFRIVPIVILLRKQLVAESDSVCGVGELFEAGLEDGM